MVSGHPKIPVCFLSIAYLLYGPPYRISKYMMKYRVWCPAHKKQFKHYCDVCSYSKDLARGKWLIYSRTRLHSWSLVLRLREMCTYIPGTIAPLV